MNELQFNGYGLSVKCINVDSTFIVKKKKKKNLSDTKWICAMFLLLPNIFFRNSQLKDLKNLLRKM